MNASTTEERKAFEQKVWIACGIIALVVVLLWSIKAVFQVLLLILTAVLVAIYFQRLAGLIKRKTKLGKKASLAVSVLGTIILMVLLFWFIGAKVQQQVSELSQSFPEMLQNAKAQISKSPIGSQVMQSLGGKGGSMQKLGPAAQRFFTSSFGVLGDLYAILFLGIFFTISPKQYVDGMVKLIPPKGKKPGRQVLEQTGKTLGDWLKGQLFAMLVVAVLTFIGLAILGVPMALALALIAGILNFVPNIGPLISMVPAVMVSLMQGTNTALMVAGLYLLVQALESNLITPFIQNKMISIPPALILIGQLVFGTMLGAWGIILATPLVAMLMVVVDELYVKKQQTVTAGQV